MPPRPSEAPECDFVFVYGTLRRGFELHHHLVRVRAKYCGGGEVAGSLFDRGRYPGARPSSREDARIRGEVYQLRQPARDLRILDEIEGCTPGAAEGGEFVRQTTDVALDSGARRRAWVYWLREGIATGQRIASGDYARWRRLAGHRHLSE
jgi:gamma-glutamylcyclotransferase (GGCT)/AIG2-like uncharacterized protein YtfP